MTDHEFYIGYEGPIPPRARRRVRAFVAGAFAAGAFVVASVLAAQRPFAPSRFDLAHLQRVSGVLVRDPYPALASAAAPDIRTWLVGPGKHGADALVAADIDRAVTLRGYEIRRGETAMLEVTLGSMEPAPGAAPALATRLLGRVTLRGEIVDAKCFLGVMNPGERTVHRDCAVRCISGGIPPMLVARDASGREALVTLVSASGQPVGHELLDLVARPVEVAGALEERAGAFFLRANRQAYRLLER